MFTLKTVSKANMKYKEEFVLSELHNVIFCTRLHCDDICFGNNEIYKYNFIRSV